MFAAMVDLPTPPLAPVEGINLDEWKAEMLMLDGLLLTAITLLTFAIRLFSGSPEELSKEIQEQYSFPDERTSFHTSSEVWWRS